MNNINILLSLAALAGTSSALTSTDAACLSRASQFLDAPQPTPSLVSFIASLVGTGPLTAPGESTPLPGNTLEDPLGYQELFCSVAAELPESLKPDFQSYGAALLSYGSVHLSDYDAYITSCITTGAAAASLTSELHAMFTRTGALCPQAAATTTSVPSNGTYPTSAGTTPTPTSSSTMIPTAAAARPTGLVVGAAAIGGLLGAVAML